MIVCQSATNSQAPRRLGQAPRSLREWDRIVLSESKQRQPPQKPGRCCPSNCRQMRLHTTHFGAIRGAHHLNLSSWEFKLNMLFHGPGLRENAQQLAKLCQLKAVSQKSPGSMAATHTIKQWCSGEGCSLGISSLLLFQSFSIYFIGCSGNLELQKLVSPWPDCALSGRVAHSRSSDVIVHFAVNRHNSSTYTSEIRQVQSKNTWLWRNLFASIRTRTPVSKEDSISSYIFPSLPNYERGWAVGQSLQLDCAGSLARTTGRISRHGFAPSVQILMLKAVILRDLSLHPSCIAWHWETPTSWSTLGIWCVYSLRVAVLHPCPDISSLTQHAFQKESIPFRVNKLPLQEGCTCLKEMDKKTYNCLQAQARLQRSFRETNHCQAWNKKRVKNLQNLQSTNPYKSAVPSCK